MLLVDCYNLLHTSMPPALAGLDEARLCRLLSRGHRAMDWTRIVVACDGDPKPRGLIASPVAEVELIYSGRNRSADDILIDLIQRDSAPRRLTVVSSDHAIRAAARRRRARIHTSDQFVGQLLQLLSVGNGQSTVDKPSFDRLTEDEVQDWLETFDLTDGDPPPRLPWGYEEQR